MVICAQTRIEIVIKQGRGWVLTFPDCVALVRTRTWHRFAWTYTTLGRKTRSCRCKQFSQKSFEQQTKLAVSIGPAFVRSLTSRAAKLQVKTQLRVLIVATNNLSKHLTAAYCGYYHFARRTSFDRASLTAVMFLRLLLTSFPPFFSSISRYFLFLLFASVTRGHIERMSLMASVGIGETVEIDSLICFTDFHGERESSMGLAFIYCLWQVLIHPGFTHMFCIICS